MTKSNFGRREFIWLTQADHGISEWSLRTQGTWREPGGRNWSRNHGGMLPMGLLNLLTYTTQNHLPWRGTTHSDRGLPTSVINQENVPIGQSYRGIFSTEVSFSQITLFCFKLTKTSTTPTASYQESHRTKFRTLSPNPKTQKRWVRSNHRKDQCQALSCL